MTFKYADGDFNPTEEQVGNFKKLAEYLISLPENYTNFSMSNFHLDLVNEEYYDPDECVYSKDIPCDTVACALGHTPSVISCESFDSWWNVARKVYGITHPTFDEFSTSVDFISANVCLWCFGARWESVDNSPQGAGKRIMWFLDNGLPNNWFAQMEGVQKLCYL